MREFYARAYHQAPTPEQLDALVADGGAAPGLTVRRTALAVAGALALLAVVASSRRSRSAAIR